GLGGVLGGCANRRRMGQGRRRRQCLSLEGEQHGRLAVPGPSPLLLRTTTEAVHPGEGGAMSNPVMWKQLTWRPSAWRATMEWIACLNREHRTCAYLAMRLIRSIRLFRTLRLIRSIRLIRLTKRVWQHRIKRNLPTSMAART